MYEQTGLSVQCNIILNNGDMCGIPAIGHCDACQRAYCTSHQAYRDNSFGGFVPVRNLCVMCEKERLKAEEERTRKDIELARSIHELFHDGSALAMMRGSGVQKVRVYKSEAYRETIRSGYITKKHYSFLGDGWVLGEYKWSNVKDTLAYHEESWKMQELPDISTYVTVLLDIERHKLRKELLSNHGLVPVVLYADGYEYEDEYGYRRNMLGGLRYAAEAVKKLAGMPNDV